jgi:hypothetical protein
MNGQPNLIRRERLKRANQPSPGRRTFTVVRCAFCRRGLHDSQGRPRWDVVGSNHRIAFVCQGGCP